MGKDKFESLREERAGIAQSVQSLGMVWTVGV
jgi:hypothetical protein